MLFLILEALIVVLEELISPFVLSKDFWIVILFASISFEFFKLSVFKFPPTFILLELVISLVFKFSFTVIFPLLVRLFVSVFLAINLLELKILLAIIFSLANILFVFIISFSTVRLLLKILPLLTKFWVIISFDTIFPSDIILFAIFRELVFTSLFDNLFSKFCASILVTAKSFPLFVILLAFSSWLSIVFEFTILSVVIFPLT